MAQTVCLIPGDGIGPEVAHAARRVIDASGARAGRKRGSSWHDATASTRKARSMLDPLSREEGVGRAGPRDGTLAPAFGGNRES